ncbi:MAG: protein kinase [Planctomycetes bacterium]|nr:protein kinase [Planctomycetota bacterium]MCB9828643.1 protein kinase [Planctomycetota bacterium]MCB9901004.1 protein kinase [Planctomycetota bacterium]
MGLRAVQELYIEALDQPVTLRQKWVRERCAEDVQLASSVLELLQWEQAASDEPSLRIAPTGLLDVLFQQDERPRRVPGDRLLDRYRVEEQIGDGGFSRVYRCVDEITGGAVAAKLTRLPALGGSDLVETEISLLRYLALPGVVRVIDDGVDGDALCLVTEFIAGTPFPGQGGDSPELLLGRVRSLLLALGRLHEAGVLHNDLKPGNVLVSADGQLTLIDLGVALDAVHGDASEASRWGTPAYVAPERMSGGVPTVQSDLFSVGMMVADCNIATVEPLIRLSRACISTFPSDRPRSAIDALGLLGRPAIEGLPSTGLADLIAGPERIHHARSRALELATWRSRQSGISLDEELREWVDGGWVEIRDGRVHISPRQIDQLERRPPTNAVPGDNSSQQAFRRYVASFAQGGVGERVLDDPWEELPGRIADLSESLRARAPDSSLELLIETCRRFAAQEELLGVSGLYVALTEAAMANGTVDALHRSLYCLRAATGARAEQLTQVLRAGVAALQAKPDECFAMLQVVMASALPDVLRLAHSVRVLAAARSDLDMHRMVVSEAVSWAEAQSDDDVTGLALSWRGWLHYREEEFGDAARCHELAAERLTRAPARWRARLNAAAAWLDHGSHDLALAHARACLSSSDDLHLDRVQVARAEALTRTAQYGACHPLVVDHALVQAVKCGIPDQFAARVYLTEAAIAWRSGNSQEAAELAGQAARLYEACGRATSALLATSLAVAAGHPWSTKPLTAALISRGPPGIMLQVAALLTLGGRPVTPCAEVAARRASECLTRWSVRREVCSPSEAISWLDRPRHGT